MCSLFKEQSIDQGRQFKMRFFLRIMPLFRLGLVILYQAPNSRHPTLAPACVALIELYFLFCLEILLFGKDLIETQDYMVKSSSFRGMFLESALVI